MNYFFISLNRRLHLLGICGNDRFLYTLPDHFSHSHNPTAQAPAGLQFRLVERIELPDGIIAHHFPAYLATMSACPGGGKQFFELRELGDEDAYLDGEADSARLCILSTAVFPPVHGDAHAVPRWQPWIWVYVPGLTAMHVDDDGRERRLYASSGAAHAVITELYSDTSPELLLRVLVLIQFPLANPHATPTCELIPFTYTLIDADDAYS
jgi:hypothetical protein